jgi:integrase
VPVRYKSDKPTNKKEAEIWAAEKWEYARQHAPPAQNGPLLKDFLSPYFIPGHCPHIERVLGDKGRYTDKWAAQQRAALDAYILPDPIAGIAVSKLRPGDFEDLKKRLKQYPISPRTINIIMGALKTAIKEGYHRGDIDHDPTVGVGKLREDSKETGVFMPGEISRIFSSPEAFASRQKNFGIARGRKDSFLAYTFFLLCALTGERPDAILSLCWADIEDDVLHFEKTKTMKDRRVPVVPAVRSGLEKLKQAAVNPAPAGYVFGYEDGSRCGRTWYRKRFYSMMRERLKLPEKDAEGRKRVPYSFKHSLITHLLDAGADEILVREYVGHAHTYGSTRVLTPVQAKYKHRQAERLRKLLPMIETLYEIEYRNQ